MERAGERRRESREERERKREREREREREERRFTGMYVYIDSSVCVSKRQRPPVHTPQKKKVFYVFSPS